jgi:hypothetical protein
VRGRRTSTRGKLRNYALGVCLFAFLFVIIGGGFHLTPGAALIGALSGTPLVIYAFSRWCDAQFRREEAQREAPAREIFSLRARHEISAASAPPSRPWLPLVKTLRVLHT